MRKTVTGLLLVLVPALTGTAAAQAPDFFSLFQVFSLGDIGGPEDPFSGDIQGVTGARGSTWFDRVSLNELGGAFPSGLHAGGSVTLAGCVERGGIEAGGWVELGASSIAGSVSAGLEVTGCGGAIAGDVLAGTATILDDFTVLGMVTEGAPFEPSVDLQAAGEFFRQRSACYASRRATGEPRLGSHVVFTACPGMNVFHVPADALNGVSLVTIVGPASATVVINIVGAEVEIADLAWQLDPEIPIDRVLINLPTALHLRLQQVAIIGNVLAPYAEVDFPMGLVLGGLWVGSLRGGGTVHWGSYSGDDQPTPSEVRTWGGLKHLFR